MLSVAIVHHHLRGGGVTRVIANAVHAMRERGVSAVVLSGEAPPDDFPSGVAVEVVPGLAYAADAPAGAATNGVGDLLREMRTAARRALGGEPALWHVHNHCLGKNPQVTLAVRQLASQEVPLLLQIHDFAEDGRPVNYRGLRRALEGQESAGLPDVLYPMGARVHYALLNRRDANALVRAGLPEPRCHVLPNSVSLGEEVRLDPAPARDEALVVYPTRAIRRKNLGEFILWALCDPERRFAVTLAPKNPEAREVYESWVAFAESANLPVTFEYGAKTQVPFATLLASAGAAATASVGEGFGLAFLEPWLAGTPVVGRDLPSITQDFKEEGIDLYALYERLDVPLEWVGREPLRNRLAAAMQATWEAYGRHLPESALEKALDAAVQGDWVDFGRLDEPLQREALHACRKDAASREHVRRTVFGQHSNDAGMVDRNRQAVQDRFSAAAYAEKLENLYRLAIDDDGGNLEHLDPERVLDAFLEPRRFTLLRS